MNRTLDMSPHSARGTAADRRAEPGSEPATGFTVAFRTLGCKLNQCETAQMEESLRARGFRVVAWGEPADARVLNTCTVTAKTDRACRHEIRRAKRRDPSSRIVVTGCYAQTSPEAVAAIPAVDLVLGNLDKSALPDHLATLLQPLQAGLEGTTSAQPLDAETSSADTDARDRRLRVTPYAADTGFSGEVITHFSGYTRAFLKVQNGCDAACTYCIIPRARGPARSMPRDAVLAQVRVLAQRGFREVVLTGIHLGAWGSDTVEGDLADLLEALAVDRPTPEPRLRLSSTEPMEVDDRVLTVMRRHRRRFAEHLHVPMQSGSASVLERMNRPYTREQYAERVRAIRAAFPDAAIGADVIVGFPGETDAEFQETVDLVTALPLTYLHVFAYSDRPGTPASAMGGKVHPEVIEERSLRLRTLGATKRAAFEAGFVGREQRALVLSRRTPDGRLVALTGTYIEVHVPGGDDLVNRFAQVKMERPAPDDGWWGTVVSVEAP